ncbi:FecR domain-containing protein [Fulvivirgaceae bacterium PWU4]|uniref:FecR domain-containing protein n=1 Tax=Chryseosolibacter histidini TaxID=2782349 RepID=A0AAP2DKB6_9BACT|nr:FecR family protein [Chryseosolibacter histidini]MBT1697925.1 FecR domain-containing protein [Chryseosolibacter histidini]
MTNDFKVLLQRFLDQTITPEEDAEFRKLLNSGLYDEYWGNELFGSLVSEPQIILGKDEEALERVYRNALKARAEATLSPEVELVVVDRKRVLKRWLAVAAMISIVLVPVVWLSIGSTETSEKLTEIKGPARFQLPDKSSVLLDNNTILTYNEATFGKGIREVALTGQAFFKVTHDATAPFVVRSEEMTTTVLGTSFNVNSRPQKDKRVTVSEGKVEVKDADDRRAYITPGQQIMLSAGHDPLKHEVNIDTVLAWKGKFILFDKISLGEVAQRLEERFNVAVKFSDEALKSIIIEASFVKDEDMEISNVLTVVCTTANIDFMLNEQTVMFSAKAHASL